MAKGQKILVYFIGVAIGSVVLMLFPDKPESAEHPWHQQTAVEGYYPLVIQDDYGREVRLKKQPRWLVSLAPSITEMLFAMGMGDHILAVTEWDAYPEKARRLRDSGGSVGSLDHPDLEAIAALRPDLVVASNLTDASVLSRIEQGRTKAISLHHDSFEDIFADIATLGRVLGVPGRALDLVTSLKEKRDAILERLEPVRDEPRRRAVILLHLEDGAQPGWSPGAGTWLGELIEMAHGENIAAALASSYGQLSLEAMLQADPEVIFVKEPHGEGARERLRARIDDLADHPIWGRISAVRNGRVVVVENGPFSIPGPRVVEALEAVAEGLWPETMGTPGEEATDD